MPVTRSMMKKGDEPPKAKTREDPPRSRIKKRDEPAQAEPVKRSKSKSKEKTRKDEVDGAGGKAKKAVASTSKKNGARVESPLESPPEPKRTRKTVITLKTKAKPVSKLTWPSPTKHSSPFEAFPEPRQQRVVKKPVRLDPSCEEPKSMSKKPPKGAKVVTEAVTRTTRAQTLPSPMKLTVPAEKSSRGTSDPSPQKPLSGLQAREKPAEVPDHIDPDLDPEPEARPKRSRKGRKSIGFKTVRRSRVSTGKPMKSGSALKIQLNETKERDQKHLQKMVTMFGLNGPWEKRIVQIKEKAETMRNGSKKHIDAIFTDTKENWEENKNNPKKAVAQTPMMRKLRSAAALDAGGMKKNLKFTDSTQAQTEKDQKEFAFSKPAIGMIKNVKKRVRSSDTDTDSPAIPRQHVPTSFDFKSQKERKDERPAHKKLAMDSSVPAAEIPTPNQAGANPPAKTKLDFSETQSEMKTKSSQSTTGNKLSVPAPESVEAVTPTALQTVKNIAFKATESLMSVIRPKSVEAIKNLAVTKNPIQLLEGLSSLARPAKIQKMTSINESADPGPEASIRESSKTKAQASDANEPVSARATILLKEQGPLSLISKDREQAALTPTPSRHIAYSESEDQAGNNTAFVTCPIEVSSLSLAVDPAEPFKHPYPVPERDLESDEESFKSCSSNDNSAFEALDQITPPPVDVTYTVGLTSGGAFGDKTYYVGAAPTPVGNKTFNLGPKGPPGNDTVNLGSKGPAVNDTFNLGPKGSAGNDTFSLGAKEPLGNETFSLGAKGPVGNDTFSLGVKGPLGNETIDLKLAVTKIKLPAGPDDTFAVPFSVDMLDCNAELTDDESFEMSFSYRGEEPEPTEEKDKASYDITLYEDLNDDNSHRADKVLPDWASNREFLVEQLYAVNPSNYGTEMDELIFPPMPKFKLFPGAMMPRRKP